MYDVIKNYKRPSPELLEAFSKIEESASLHEVMGKKGALSPDIRPVWPRQRMVGSALTVYSRPGDNLMLHKALQIAKPGDVIMMNNEGCTETGGMVGGIMLTSAKARGIVGLVTDGSCRDTMMIEKISFPVWSRGISIKGTTKAVPGTINHPIVLGGVVVNPGDIVFADNDGIVVIPLGIAEEVLKLAQEREANEEGYIERIEKEKISTFELSGFEKKWAELGLTEEPDET